MAPPSSRAVVGAAVAATHVATAAVSVVVVTVGDDPVGGVHAGRAHGGVLVTHVVIVTHRELLALVARQTDRLVDVGRQLTLVPSLS